MGDDSLASLKLYRRSRAQRGATQTNSADNGHNVPDLVTPTAKPNLSSLGAPTASATSTAPKVVPGAQLSARDDYIIRQELQRAWPFILAIDFNEFWLGGHRDTFTALCIAAALVTYSYDLIF
jgi:hypothetical protein